MNSSKPHSMGMRREQGVRTICRASKSKLHINE